jgi:UPF0716 protein FxsA
MPAVLLAAFLVVPLLELAVIVQVQQSVGLGWTLAALVAISIAGAMLVKREGLKAWKRFREALDEARLPAAEVVDGALLLLAGALLLTPGFLTDTVGLLLLLPPSRAVVNRALRGRVRQSFGLPGPAQRGARGSEREGDLEVEVIDVRRDDGSGKAEPPPHGELR